jgi:hypothetical protein
MERPELLQAQQQQLNETLERAHEFEETVRTRGFARIKAHYENRVRAFVNELLIQDDKDIKEFEKERFELIGLRKMFGSIESDLKVLSDERQRPNPPAQ